MAHNDVNSFRLGLVLCCVALVQVRCSTNPLGAGKLLRSSRAYRVLDAKEGNEDDISYSSHSGSANPTVSNARRGIFTSLGGRALSRPRCVSWGPGRVDCFYQGPRTQVIHKTIENGQYSEEDLGGVVVGEVECVSRKVGVIDIIGIGTDRNMHIKTYAGGKWGDRKWTGGAWRHLVSCTAPTAETIDCLAVNFDNQVFSHVSKNGKWSGYDRLEQGVVETPFACSSRSEKYLNCFAVGQRGHLRQVYRISGRWGTFEDLEGWVKGRPCVTAWDENRLDVFALGAKKNDIMQLTYEGGGNWQPWVSLGGSFGSPPECVTTGVNRIYCFAVGERSYLYMNSYNGKAWAGWEKSFGFFLETPSCVVSNENEISCYIRRFSEELVEIAYKLDAPPSAGE